MANLSKKGDVFCVRFRYRSKEYKKSLKTRDEPAARAALHLVELTLHRLHTGQLHVPDRVDPGDFVISGGTLLAPVERRPAVHPLCYRIGPRKPHKSSSALTSTVGRRTPGRHRRVEHAGNGRRLGCGDLCVDCALGVVP
jgi:hypothetical protein